MNYAELLASIKQTFIDQDNYFFDKHTPEFIKDGKFLGDYFNQLAVEPKGDKPPRFYHVFSPFDVISNKAPEYAVVFENGELLLHIDFTKYIAMRTAAMNAIVLQTLGIKSLVDKKVLLFGSGKIATEAVKVLASELQLQSIDVINRSGDLATLKADVKDIGVGINLGSLENLDKYDVIICHTQTKSPLLSEDQIKNIKQGAVLTSFISSTEHGEYPDEIYNFKEANIITDLEASLLTTKDLKRALDNGLLTKENLLYIKDLLGGKNVDSSKHYTVYRSTGTPIQNLAILKLLV